MFGFRAMQSMDLRSYRRAPPAEHTNQIGSAPQRCVWQFPRSGNSDPSIYASPRRGSARQPPGRNDIAQSDVRLWIDKRNRVDAEVGRGGIIHRRWVLRRKECLSDRVTVQKL